MKALLPFTLTILLSRTICAIDNALKAYENGNENSEGQPRRWTAAADEDDDGTDKVPTVRSAPSLQSLKEEETEEQEQFRPAYHQQMDKLLSDRMNNRLNELPSDRMDELPSDRMDELPSDRMNELPSDRMNELPSDRMNELPSDRMNELSSDRMNQLPSDRMNELSSDRMNNWNRMNEFPRDDGRGTMVDVDIVKGHKGLRMREDEELVDEVGDEEDPTTFGLPLGEEEERRAKVPSSALSLVPKRRRRIGTIGGRPSIKSAIRKYGKMTKSSIPVIFPDSGGIDLNVQSDFVEKNDETTTEGSTTTPTTSSTTTEQQQKPKKFKEEEEKKRSNSSILYGRDFWANALRTLLIEFRKLHPELASGKAQQARRRAGLRTNSSSSSTTGTSIGSEKGGGHRKPKPKSKEGEGEGGTTDGAWRGTDNRLDE